MHRTTFDNDNCNRMANGHVTLYRTKFEGTGTVWQTATDHCSHYALAFRLNQRVSPCRRGWQALPRPRRAASARKRSRGSVTASRVRRQVPQ